MPTSVMFCSAECMTSMNFDETHQENYNNRHRSSTKQSALSYVQKRMFHFYLFSARQQWHHCPVVVVYTPHKLYDARLAQ